MNSQHTYDSLRLLATSCLISWITITYLTSSIEGSNVKTDGWSNSYNQRPYSDLTGTMRELTSTDNNDDTDTRFQPPLDTNNQKVQPIAEGYRLASTEMISPAISVSINKDLSRDRHKRDVPFDNTTISTATLQSVISVNTEPITTKVSNNATDDESILSEADANSWALDLSLQASVDGSGSEFETTEETGAPITTQTETTVYSLTSTISSVQNETEIIIGYSTLLTTEATSMVSTTAYVTGGEFNNTGVSQASFTLTSSASTTITSMEGTQMVTEASTSGVIVTSTTSGQSSTKEVTNNMSGTEVSSTTTSTLQSSTAVFPGTEEGSTVQTTLAASTFTPTTQIGTGQSTVSVGEETVSATEVTASTTISILSTITSSGSLGTQIMTTAEAETTMTGEAGTPTSTVSTSSVPTASSAQTATISETEGSMTPSNTVQSTSQTTTSITSPVQTNTENVASTATVSESEFTSFQSTLSTLTTVQTVNPITQSSSSIGITSTPPSVTGTEAGSSSTTASITSTSAIQTSTGTNPEITLFNLYFNYKDQTSGRRKRQISNNLLASTILENEIADILSNNGISCNGTCIQVTQNNNTIPPDLEFLVVLNKLLNVAQRINLVDQLFENNVTVNDSYVLGIVQISMNVTTVVFSNFNNSIPACRECEYNGRGNCSNNDTDCTCLPQYSGLYCRDIVTTASVYIPTSISTSTATLSTTIVSSVQTGGSFTESTSTTSQSSTTYSTSTTITEVTGTTETETASITLPASASTASEVSPFEGTSSSTTSTATNSLFSPTGTETIENTGVSSSLTTTTGTVTETETVEITSATTTQVITGGVSTSSSTTTLAVTEGTTSSTITATGITSQATETMGSISTTPGPSAASSTPAITAQTSSSTTTIGITTGTATGGASSSSTTAATSIISSTITPAVTGETSSSTPITGTGSISSTTPSITGTGETSSSTPVTGTGSISSTTTSITGTSETSSSTPVMETGSTTTSITGTSETSSSTPVTGTGSISSTITSITGTGRISSTTTPITATGETSSSTPVTETGSISSTTTPITGTGSISSTTASITGAASISSTTTHITGTSETSSSTPVIGTGETSSSTPITGTGSFSSTTTSITGTGSISSTTTHITGTSETSSSTPVTGTGSISSTITSNTGTGSISSTTTSITGTSETSSSTPVTGTGSISSTITSITGTGSISSTTTSIIGTSETSSSTPVTGTGSISSTTTSITGTGSISSTTTHIAETSETSSSTPVTGTSSISSTTTPITGTGSISSTTTHITGTGETSSSTPVTGTGSISSTTTSNTGTGSISSTITSITGTSETSSSTSVTGTGSITSTTTPITGTGSISSTITSNTGTGSISSTTTHITGTGETSSSTPITGTGSISSTTTSITGTGSISSTATPITGTGSISSTTTSITRTSETSSSTPITGTGSISSTTTSITGTGSISSTATPITGTSSISSTTTHITGTGETSSSTPVTGTGSTSSRTTLTATAQSISSVETTSSVTEQTATGETSSSISNTGTGSTITGQTSFSTTTTGTTQIEVTGQSSSSTATTGSGSASSSSTSTMTTESISLQTSGVTEQTVTRGTSSSTVTIGTVTISSTVAGQTSFSTTTIGTTQIELTGQTSSSTVTTGTVTVSSTTVPTITGQTSFSTITTGTTQIQVTGQTSSSTATAGTSSIGSTITSAVTPHTSYSITGTGTSTSTTRIAETGETTPLTTITGIITSSSSIATGSTATSQTISSTTTSGGIQETVTSAVSPSTATIQTGTSSSITSSSILAQTTSHTTIIGTTEGTVTSEATSQSISSTITTTSSATGQSVTSEITNTGPTGSISTTASSITSTGISGTTQETGTIGTSTLSTITATSSASNTFVSSATTQTISTTSGPIRTSEGTLTSEVTSASITTETSSSVGTSTPITSAHTTSVSETATLTTTRQTTGSIGTTTSTGISGTTEITSSSITTTLTAITPTVSTSVTAQTTSHSSTATAASSTSGQTGISGTTTVTTFVPTTSSSTILITTGTVSVTATTASVTSATSSSVTSTAQITTMATSTTQVVTTTVLITTSATTITTTTTTITQRCTWTSWVPFSNCTPSCGTAYQLVIRSCINPTTGQSCDSSACGGGSAIQNQSCTSSPPCGTVVVTPQNTTRDPSLRTFSYLLPDQMYFFEQNYRRIWITNKGYITFDTPYYGQTMTSDVFYRLYNQAIAAPFWADLTYDSTSNITINWFSSLNASQSDMSTYYSIVQQTVNEACPVLYCSESFSAIRVVRINWSNLYYQPANSNQTTVVSFTAYLINTYETPSFFAGYPVVRSYLAFDYGGLTNNLGYLKPFVGYRGKSSFLQVVNDPSYYQNAIFLRQSSHQSFYIGGRYLTQCEVSYIEETSYNALFPSENLNNFVNNPSNPCPCSLGQAQIDRRFSRLYSENSYELSQGVICFAPLTTSWIRLGWFFQPLRTQTCCYNMYFGGLITYGPLAGSVFTNPFILFQPYPLWRRSLFHDGCCSPAAPSGQPDWSKCSLYYQLHPPSTCSGYRPPTIVTGIGDPHLNTIDNGRYTCHIQGLYIFAQTSASARIQANNNANMSGVSDTNLLYPDDLFYIYVRSVSVPPALPYVERMAGDASIFSSYTIGAVNYIFMISNINGRFGFTASNATFNSSLTYSLSSNLNYDYINTNDTNERYTYRLQQTSAMAGNTTIPQLVLSIWSGLTIQCQIISENLNCILLLPQKYLASIEGLAGNFNGDYSDDLVYAGTNQSVLIYSADNGTVVGNDTAILAACRSWKVPNDTTVDMTNPILPINFVNWYTTNSSSTLASLNPRLSPNLVNETCSSNFECIHDYLIRVNPVTSLATATALSSFQQSRITMNQIPPTISITSAVQIAIAYNNLNRTAVIPISITGANTTTISINANGTIQNTPFNGQNITIPMLPNDNTSYVEVSLNLTYGMNSTTIAYLDIIACLCMSNTSCDYTDLTTISQHYQLASCICSDEYDGVFCQNSFNGCGLTTACQINWKNNTVCIPLNATEQAARGQSYICAGDCADGYESLDNYTCRPKNLCNSTTCAYGGTCLNTIGSYVCICPAGFQFANGTCVDINECVDRYVNGNFTAHCSVGYNCTNTIGNFTCTCEDIFFNNITNTCTYNASLCQNDRCIPIGSSSVTCIHGTTNINNTCVPWCASTCPGFCQLVDDFYQCNCSSLPGFQPSNNGLTCSQCGSLNYGYGCSQSCQCNFGTCNPNGTNVNNSCICGGYQSPSCSRRIDICALNNSCNPNTERCQTDPITGNATCTCLVGYGFNSTVNTCTDINECNLKQDQCNPSISTCVNTIGSYTCNCLSGYQSVNGSCTDIDECAENSTICSPYINTYCTNIPGSYECRCNTGYSLGGDYTQAYGNARNASASCLQSNYSSFCANQCKPPAACSPVTGQCECPSSNYKLVNDTTNDIFQTCLCPGDPFAYFNGSSCVAFQAPTNFLLIFRKQPASRIALLNSTDSNTLQTKISNILYALNITCYSTCIQLYDASNNVANEADVVVTLNVPLNVTQRLQFSNQMFNDSITYLNMPLSAIEINMNPALPNSRANLTRVEPACAECGYLLTGMCNSDETGCTCFQNYTGYLCRDNNTVPSLQSASQEANWTIIVAVVSAVAGLLLIISLVMCVFYCLSNRRQSTTITKPAITRPQFFIPRAHLPTMGTVSREMNSWDAGFSLDNTYDEQFVDASDSFPSSSTTSYNTTYRASEKRPEADFGIFDELENRTPISKGQIPRPQMKDMLGTLSSFPALDQFDEPSGETSIFSDTRDIDDIELVTDMLDDMTKDDDAEDEFVEALNPNLAIPRLSLAPDSQSSSWFSFFRNS